MLTGDSGILSNAENAKEQTNLANSKEQVALAVTGALTEGLGTITRDNLEKELNNIVGTENKDYTLSAGEGPWTVKVGDYVAIVKDNGKTKQTVDWVTVLAKANANPESYKHEETLESTYIAIGTDGKPVDMDMWVPTKNADGTFSLGSGSNYGYKKVYKDECPGGKIKGTVPQYIYNDELGAFKEVVVMDRTFDSHSELVYAPEIPSSVTSMSATFQSCTGLTQAPEIPSSVTNMYSAFNNCTSLTQAPEIPSSVTNMNNAFQKCTSLVKAPEIPSSVTSMSATFSICTGLTKAPEIPSLVTNMSNIFEGCTNLTGTIVVNANPTYYFNCFKNTVKPITLTNSATEQNTATEVTLNNLKGTANNNNVSVVLAK